MGILDCRAGEGRLVAAERRGTSEPGRIGRVMNLRTERAGLDAVRRVAEALERNARICCYTIFIRSGPS